MYGKLVSACTFNLENKKFKRYIGKILQEKKGEEKKKRKRRKRKKEKIKEKKKEKKIR